MLLTGTESSHFRKYLATLGASIVVASVSLAGLFFRIQADLLVDTNVLGRLTPEARRTLELRQAYLSAATIALPYLLAALVLLGLAFTFFGLRGWAARQRVADAREDIERDKVRVELEHLTEAGRVLRLEEEAQSAEPALTRAEDATDIPVPALIAESRINLRYRILDTERAVYNRLNEIFGVDRVTTEVSVTTFDRRRRTVDAVVYPANTVAPASRHGPSPGFVFEIKYFSRDSMFESRLVDAAMQTLEVSRALQERYATKIIACVVAVPSDDVDIGPERFDVLNAQLMRNTVGLVQVVAVRVNEIDTWDVGASLDRLIRD